MVFSLIFLSFVYYASQYRSFLATSRSGVSQSTLQLCEEFLADRQLAALPTPIEAPDF
jgi:hypothetical protein